MDGIAFNDTFGRGRVQQLWSDLKSRGLLGSQASQDIRMRRWSIYVYAVWSRKGMAVLALSPSRLYGIPQVDTILTIWIVTVCTASDYCKVGQVGPCGIVRRATCACRCRLCSSFSFCLDRIRWRASVILYLQCVLISTAYVGAWKQWNGTPWAWRRSRQCVQYCTALIQV